MLNLLLISLDTLRADVGYSGKLTSLQALAARGIAFQTTVSSSPLTPVSHASVLTGRQPPGHGIRHLFRERLPSDVPTLASILTGEGYGTGAVVSSPGLNRWYGFDRGFSYYDDWIPRLADGRDPLHVVEVEARGTALKRAPEVVDRAISWLRGYGRRPVFLFVHFFDAHWPYCPPETWGEVENAYEGEATYADHYLGALLAAVKEEGLTADNTVVLCFSDHGEDLAGWYPNDHAGTHGHPEERGHGCQLYDATQLVPLVMAAPTIPRGLVSLEQVRLVDALPTILTLLRLPDLECDGRSLAPTWSGDRLTSLTAYCETYYPEELAASDPQWRALSPLKALRTPRRKVVWRTNGDDMWEFDLVADPAERFPTSIARCLA